MSAAPKVSGAGPDAASYRLGLFLVTLSAIGWSTAGYFTRLIPLDAWTTLFWRGIFGSLTGLVFLVAQERGAALRTFSHMGKSGVLFSLLSTAGMVTFLTALKLTTVAHVAIIYATVPFLSAGLAWLAMRETVSKATLCAIVLAIVGVAITLSNGFGEGSVAGDVSALLMTVFMAASIVVLRRASVPVPTLAVACTSAVMGSLLCLPFASPLSATPQDIANLALFGASNMGLGLVCFMIGAKRIPAAQTALIGALDAPLAPVWVWLAFGETPKGTTLLGGCVVLVAVGGHIIIENAGARRRASRVGEP